MIRKLMLAIGAASLLVAMALPAFAQDGLDLLNPEANAANFGHADFGDQNATNVCGNNVADIDVTNSQSASQSQNGIPILSPQTINQTQNNETNVAVSQSVNDVRCVNVQEQEFEQEADADATNLILLLFGGGGGG